MGRGLLLQFLKPAVEIGFSLRTDDARQIDDVIGGLLRDRGNRSPEDRNRKEAPKEEAGGLSFEECWQVWISDTLKKINEIYVKGILKDGEIFTLDRQLKWAIDEGSRKQVLDILEEFEKTIERRVKK